jgi:hypothetical protein
MPTEKPLERTTAIIKRQPVVNSNFTPNSATFRSISTGSVDSNTAIEKSLTVATTRDGDKRFWRLVKAMDEVVRICARRLTPSKN